MAQTLSSEKKLTVGTCFFPTMLTIGLHSISHTPA